ncbi:hypothetical protein FHG87_008194 [Trinorchestia longiramus]|nr:hypothetical protein FHG87_008194 [Trinorchestia longiramus]
MLAKGGDHVLDHVLDHLLDHLLDHMLDHVLDHVLDHALDQLTDLGSHRRIFNTVDFQGFASQCCDAGVEGWDVTYGCPVRRYLIRDHATLGEFEISWIV